MRRRAHLLRCDRQGGAESDRWYGDPLQNGTEIRVEGGNDWHQLATGPGLPHLDVAPFADCRAGEPESHRPGDDVRPSGIRPSWVPIEEEFRDDSADRDQDIAAGVML